MLIDTSIRSVILYGSSGLYTAAHRSPTLEVLNTGLAVTQRKQPLECRFYLPSPEVGGAESGSACKITSPLLLQFLPSSYSSSRSAETRWVQLAVLVMYLLAFFAQHHFDHKLDIYVGVHVA